MITCYTIISRDVCLLDWCISNARERAGIDHKWLVVGWDATKEIIDYCRDNKIEFEPFSPYPREDFADQTSWFLKNLYACWNLGYAESDSEFIVRMGSDQAFSRNWLKHLVKGIDEKGDDAVIHTYSIESPVAKNSRHEIQDFGTSWSDFDYAKFDYRCADIIHNAKSPFFYGQQCGLFYQHRSRGIQIRPDGVSWIQSKKLWEKFGPLNDTLNDEGVAGDVSFMDKLKDNGVKQYLSTRSISYHLVRGESRDIQQ